MRKVSFSFLAVALIATISFLTVNCETGLGPSVDVQKPSVAITYPPATAAIRDAFMLFGTCDDDQGVTAIFVTIYDDNNNPVPGFINIPATVLLGGKTWSVMLNQGTDNPNKNPPIIPEKTFPLKDGAYTVQVVAMDKAGRQSDMVARSFDIDNTAPILILNKPMARANKKPTSYGRVFKLAGDTNDDHNVKISFYFWECDSPSFYTGGSVSFKGTPDAMVKDMPIMSMSSDAPLILAQYYEDPTDEDSKTFTKNYTNIYGEVDPNGNIDKYYYGGIRLMDSAKVYQNPAEDVNANNSRGNETWTYFLNTGDLSNTLKSIGTDGIKAGDIKKLANGTSSLGDDVKATVFDALLRSGNFVKCSSANDVDENSSVFILNPDNNPTWSIANYTIKKDDVTYAKDGKGYRDYNMGAAHTLTITPNTDGDYVEPEKIELYCMKVEQNSEGVWKAVGEKIYLKDENDNPTKRGWWKDEASDEAISVGGLKLEGLGSGEYYKFYLDGEDREGTIYVEADKKGYGFKVATSETAPTINITTKPLDNNSCFNFGNIKTGIVMKGTITESSKRLGYIDSSDPTKYIVPMRLFAWNVTGPNNVDYTSKLQPTLELWPTDDGVTQTHVDFSSVNSTWQNVESMNWAWELTIKDPAYDTTKYPEGDYTITFQLAATNRLGEGDGTAEKAKGRTLEPRQADVYYGDSKPPVIKEDATYKTTMGGKVINATATATTANWITSSTAPAFIVNYEETGKGGAPQLYYQIDSGSTEGPLGLMSKGSGIYQLAGNSVQFAKQGESEIKFWTVDPVGNKSDDTTYKVFIDTNIPELTYIGFKHNGVTGDDAKLNVENGKDVEVTVKATDETPGSGIKDVTFEINGTAATAATGYTVANDGSGNYTLTIPASKLSAEGNYKVTAKATDNAKNNSAPLKEFFTAVVDRTPPEFEVKPTIPTLVKEDSNAITVKDTNTYNFTVRGTWSDKISGTGKVYYSDDSGANWYALSEEEASRGATTTSSWSKVFEIPKNDQDAHSYWFKAEDSAGNVTATITKYDNIKFDFSDPTITATAVPATNNLSSPLTITVTAEDARKLAATPVAWTIKKNGAASSLVSAVVDSTADTDNGRKATYKLTFTKPTSAPLNALDGNWTIDAIVTDDVGRTGSLAQIKFMIDTVAPVLDETATTIGGKALTKGGTSASWINNTETPTLKATFTEATSGINKLYYEVIDTSASVIASGNFDMNGSGSTWTLGNIVNNVPQGEDLKKIAQGKNKIKIWAVDKAGNISSSETTEYDLWIDTVEPTVDFATWSSTGVSYTAKYPADSADISIKTESDIVVNVKPEDGTTGSGIASVTFRLDYKSAATGVTTQTNNITGTDNGDGTWSMKIEKATFTGNDGTYTVYANATDNAGLSSGFPKKPNFTVVVDRTPPKFAITSVTDADKASAEIKTATGATYVLTEESVNSIVKIDKTKYTFKLSGTWSDKNGSGTDVIYYSETGADDLATNISNKEPSARVSVAQQSSVAEGQWSQTFEIKVGDQGKHSYWVQAFDEVGNSSSTESREDIIFDFAVPKVEVNGDSIPSITNLASPLTVTITVSDDRKLANTPLAITFTKNDTVVTPSASITTSTPAWDATSKTATYTITFKKPTALGSLDELDGKWKIKATATDEVGRNSAVWESKEFEIDCTKPKLLDDAGSVTNFTFGGKNRAEIGNAVYPWFNSTAIKTAGNYEEAQSGIDMVYYWAGSEKNSTLTFVTNGSIAANDYSGTFGASKDSGIWKFNGSVTNGLDAGLNYVKFIAVDKAGNQSDPLTLTVHIDTELPEVNPSTAETTYSNGKNPKTYEGTLSDDASGVVNFVFEIGGKTIESDSPTTDATGVTTITKDGNTIELGPQDTNKVRTWKVSLTAAFLKNLGSGTFIAYGIAIDKAGNKSSKTRLFSIIMDTKAPEGKITQPVGNSTVNKKFKMQGKAEDNFELASVTLEWSKDGGATYNNKFGAAGIEFKESEAYNWVTKDDVDSETAFGNLTYSDPWDGGSKAFDSSNSAGITLKAIAIDKAGNSTEVEGTPITQVFYVNQHADRPIINITSINGEREVAKYTTQLKGTVQDDDGVVKTFIATSTPFSFDASGKITVTDNGETDLKNGSDWTFTPLDTADGMKEVYFYIVDNEDNEFYSVVGRSSEKKPYLQFQGDTENRTTLGNKFEFGIDNTVPDIDSGFAFYHGTGETDYAAKLALSDSRTEYVGGSKRNFLQFEFTAKDQNGIKEMSAVFYNGNTAITGQSYTYKDGAASGNAGTKNDKLADASGKKASVWTFELGEITDTAWADGTYSVSLTVTDGAGITSVKKYLFTTDFTAPEVSMTSPAIDIDETKTPPEKIYATVIASADLKATFSDMGAGTAAGGVTWLIPTKEQAKDTTNTKIKDTDWQLPGGASITTFNKKLEWKDISKYSNITPTDKGYATEEEVEEEDAGGNKVKVKTGRLEVPVWFKTEDILGNVSIAKEKFYIDPDASLAKAKVVSPKNSDKVGSSLTLNGTASVDEGTIQEVRLQIDANGDGVFDAKDYAILSGNATDAHISSAITANRASVLTNLNKKWKKFAEKAPSKTTATKRIVEGNGVDTWYVVADGTNSWSLTFDASLFNSTYIVPTGDDGNPKILFRAIAYDGRSNFTEAGVERTGADKEHIRAWPAYTKDSDPITDKANIDKVNADEKVAMIKVTVDAGVPTITNIFLVQYDASDKVVVSRKYDAGMYISNSTKLGSKDGKWYLVATLEDETALASFKVSTNIGATTVSGYNLTVEAEESEDAAENWEYTPDPGEEDVKKITFKKEVALTDSTTAQGRIYLEVTATDKTGKAGAAYIDINIDNQAPAMKRVATAPNSELALTNTLNQTLGATYFVENNDGSFTFGGTMEEMGSGLAYLAFWFERKPKETDPYLDEKRVYDPMRAHGTETGKKYANQTKLTDNTTATTGELYINSDGLAVMPVTVTRGSTTTLTLTAADANIRKGSLVKIGGAYVMIDSISGTTITLVNEVDTQFTDAELVYAQIVNRMGIEPGEGAAYDGLCDGDDMIEMVKFKNGLYTWTGDIQSMNIPDGPIIIHAVAIDEAGNLESGIVTTKVANNRPRVTRVMVGTDWNGSDKFKIKDTYQNVSNVADVEKATPSGTQFGEFVYYSTIDRTLEDRDHPENEDVMAKAVVTLNGGSPFVVSKELCVIPRFTGGNGVLKYGWNVTKTEENTPVSGTLSLKSTADDLNIDTEGISQATLDQLIQDTKEGAAYKYGGLIIETGLGEESEPKKLAKYESWKKNKTKAQAWQEEPRYFNFTFWDATQETDQGTDSLYALVRLPAVVNVIDDIAPEAFIQPFYWNDWDDSSTVMAGENKPAGHIDLEKDIEPASTKPGVSGQVYIEGYVKDDTRLGGIYITTPDNNASGSETYKIATYAGGKWTKETLPTGAAHVKVIDIEDVQEPSQTGHIAYYRVAVDMTKYGVRDSQNVYVSAIDSNKSVDTDKIHGKTVTGNASVAGSTQTTETKNVFRDDGIINAGYTDLYTMDFVPYIQEVEGKYRSRLGRYPVRAGETIKVKGMNFAAGATYAVKFYQSGTNGKQASTANSWTAPDGGKWTGTIPDDGYINIKAPQYSAFVEVSVTQNGVTKATQNNKNKNSVGYNVQKGKYTYEGKTNPKFIADAVPGADYWTDDCYLSVWNVDTTIGLSSNPHSGVVKKFTANNMAAGKKVLLKDKGYAMQDNLSVAENDYMVFWSSDDLMCYRTIHGNETINRCNTITGESQAQFTFPMPSVNYTIINGRAWYVSLDNYVGGSSANSWGMGLFLSRDGFKFTKSQWNGTKTNDEKEWHQMIERQGYNFAAEGRNSDDGYDSILEQFKNLRITGWYNSTEELSDASENTVKDNNNTYTGVAHIYVTYYDSYARCLKYAYFRAAGNIGKDNCTIGGKWGSDNGSKDLQAIVRTAGGNMINGKAVVAGYDTTTTNPGESDFTEQAGEWNDVVVDPKTHTPVIVYYNKTQKRLEVAASTKANPTAARVNGTGGDGDWTKSYIKPEGAGDFGRYCSAAVDKNGNLHVAAQDADSGALWYLFLKKSGVKYTIGKSCIVDKTSSVGRWTSIDLAAPDSADADNPYLAKPVISYIDTAYLNTTRGTKVAYVYSITEKVDGVDVTTYMWDAITDPAKYEAYDQLTSVMPNVRESSAGSPKTGMIGVGFNSNVYAVDFLRDEK